MTGYRDIADAIEQKVLAGDYGGRLPTIEELSVQYSVSRVTMQRAIGLLKEREVVTATPGRGISPTRIKRPRTHVLGAVLGVSMGSPLHDQMIGGMQQEAALHNEMVAIAPGTHLDPLKEVEQIRSMLNKQKVDGIILWPSSQKKLSPGVEFLIDEDIPFVVVPECDPRDYRDCNAVSNFDATGSGQVMTHLLGTGHRAIAFVTGREMEKNLYSQNRFEQYRKSMELAGLSPAEPLYFEAFPGKEKPFGNATALFCATDTVGLEVFKACLQRGIRVPDDIVVVGYDNTQCAETIGLSSVEQHFENIGKMAIDLLLRDIEGEVKEKEHLHVESELVVRSSS